MDPGKESSIFLKDFDPKYFYLIVGLGFGYHIAPLLDSERLLVLEPDNELVKLYQREKPNKLPSHLLTGNTEELEIQLEESLRDVDPRLIRLLTHPASLRIKKNLYQPISQMTHNYLQRQLLNVITDSNFGRIWAINLLKNISPSLQAPKILNNSNAPVIILGSGFSAINAIPFLKKNKKKLILITIPPVLRLLMRHEIEPDLIVLADPGYANRFYNSQTKTPLLTYLTANNQYIRSYQGPVYYCNSLTPIDHEFAQGLPVLPMGGSVASTVLEVAKNISNHIIIAGFDFSFLANYYHYPGNSLELEILFQSHCLGTQENRLYTMTRPDQPCFLKSFSGKDLRTNIAMQSYYQEFVNRIQTNSQKQYYGLSKESVYLPGVRLIDDKNWLFEARDKQFEVSAVIAGQGIKEKLLDLLKSYEQMELNKPFLKTHLAYYLLKNISYKLETDQMIFKIKHVLKQY
jgi:hypothetical protein